MPEQQVERKMESGGESSGRNENWRESTSRSRAFTTGAGRCSFTERGEEKRRRRRQPCFLAAEAEAEACRSLLESTGRAHLPRVRPCISSWLLESTRGPSAPHLQLLPVRTCSPASVDRLPVRLVCSLPPLWSPLQPCFPPLPLFLSLFLCFFPCNTSHYVILCY